MSVRSSAAEERPAQARLAAVRSAENRRAAQLGDQLRRSGQQRENRRRAERIVAGPVCGVGIVAFGLTWAASWLGLAVIVAVGAAGAAAFLLVRLTVPLTLRLLRAGPSGDDGQPRVHNLLEGLCASAGVVRPAVWVLDNDIANALVLSTDARRSRLVVTTGLVEQLSRVELEGALAQLIGRLRSGEVFPATMAVSTGWSLLPRRVRVPLAAAAQASADLAVVSLTCYPPGLAAALEGLSDELPVGGLAARLTEHLWLVSPAAPGGPRAAELRRL